MGLLYIVADHPRRLFYVYALQALGLPVGLLTILPQLVGSPRL